MLHKEFRPRTAVREEKRQANEALGRSFCKTLTEPLTNSDASAKRRHGIPQASGLVDAMLAVPKGNQLDTDSLRNELAGRYPKRTILVELVTAKSSGRPSGEVVVVDQAEGMNAAAVEEALTDIAGDRSKLARGMLGRNLFGRGLSDVMRAHSEPVLQTFDGRELTVARGEWRKDGWTIAMDYEEAPSKARLAKTFLSPGTAGTAVRFVITDRKRCHIPDASDVGYRLANFYMLRLIASDPNLEILVRQHRAAGPVEERLQYDFPLGQVIESSSRSFDPRSAGLDAPPLAVDFLVARTDSDRGLRGLGVDRDARENGLLIVDDFDAVYDLTFADPDYEKADFLARIYGLVRVNGLRAMIESYLNAEAPTSPLRPDRDGFNRDHEFSRALLQFIATQLRPIYERERQRAKEKERDNLSSETKKRITDALKHLNRYFQQITELLGDGTGRDRELPAEPKEPVVFFPHRTSLVVDRPRHVLLLVRDDMVSDGAEVVATATEGLTVLPETDVITKRDSPRWSPHKRFFGLSFSISCSEPGRHGRVTAIVEGKDGTLIEATLEVDDVLPERLIPIPETLEFRPTIATGRPGRRNHLVLYVNPAVISAGHYVRLGITKRTGRVELIDPDGSHCQEFDVKLSIQEHQVPGQPIFRVLIPWSGTSWNQYAKVEAAVRIGGGLTANATIRLDEQEDGGFFKDVKYEEIDPLAPSQFAAGTVTVNTKDPLNRHVFGDSKEEFDARLSSQVEAQQRLANLLLEEASFRALEQLYADNRLHFAERREIAAVHEQIDKYKFHSAVDVYRALART